jgi:hypothetical protein
MRVRLKQDARASVTALLLEHCRVVSGFAEYESGWDDDRVSRESGVRMGEIARARKWLVGPARYGRRPGRELEKKAALRSGLRAAEERIADLEARLRAAGIE